MPRKRTFIAHGIDHLPKQSGIAHNETAKQIIDDYTQAGETDFDGYVVNTVTDEIYGYFPDYARAQQVADALNQSKCGEWPIAQHINQARQARTFGDLSESVYQISEFNSHLTDIAHALRADLAKQLLKKLGDHKRVEVLIGDKIIRVTPADYDKLNSVVQITKRPDMRGELLPE